MTSQNLSNSSTIPANYDLWQLSYFLRNILLLHPPERGSQMPHKQWNFSQHRDGMKYVKYFHKYISQSQSVIWIHDFLFKSGPTHVGRIRVSDLDVKDIYGNKVFQCFRRKGYFWEISPRNDINKKKKNTEHSKFGFELFISGLQPCENSRTVFLHRERTKEDRWFNIQETKELMFCEVFQTIEWLKKNIYLYRNSSI